MATVAKRLPFLKEDKSATFQDIYDYCEGQDKIKLYDSILESKQVIENNYKLMQLYAPSAAPYIKQGIRDALENYPKSLNKTEVRKMFTVDGIGELDWSDLFSTMTKISYS